MEGPRVKIEMFTEREVARNPQTPHAGTRVPTTSIEPGEVLFYTIQLVNEGGSPATNVEVNNPIPKGATYVPLSASGKGSTPLISTDNARSFVSEKKYSGLLPESVTDLRWVVDDMPAGSRRKLEFQVHAMGQEATSIARFWTTFYLWLLGTLSK